MYQQPQQQVNKATERMVMFNVHQSEAQIYNGNLQQTLPFTARISG